MNNFFSILLCGPLALLVVTCGDDAAVSQPGTSDIYPIIITTDAFQYILHDGVKREQAAQIGDSLMANYERIMRHLRVSSMPQVAISIWSREHSDDFYAEMKNRIGQVYPGATGYTPGNKEMCLLWDPSMAKGSVHEYAHLVSIALKPNIGNNPRWLWEAVAQYESRSFDHPSTWTPAQRVFPGFAELNQYNSALPYRWGYFLCSCIIERWGDDAYINLIKSNGNTQSALGITEDEFGRIAEAYVKGLAGP
jgi:hypothetical protein